MSVELNSIFENNNLKELFSQSIQNNKLVHAFILEGPDGTGKFTFAKETIKAVCCQSNVRPCNECEFCRKIEEEIAPDVSYYDIPDGKSEITVEFVREIREDSYKVPIEQDYKFYVIKNAQALNINAQNALLKILEEPPRYVYFILLCTNASLLLPTVRSRAPIFRMQTLDIETIDNILSSHYPSAASFKEKDISAYEHILHTSDGSLGYCIDNIEGEKSEGDYELYDLAKGFFKVLSKKDRSELVLLACSFPSTRNQLKKLFFYIRAGLRDVLIYIKANEQATVFFENDEELLASLSDFDSSSIMSFIDLTETALMQIDINSNINIIKSDYFSKVGALCRR